MGKLNWERRELHVRLLFNDFVSIRFLSFKSVTAPCHGENEWSKVLASTTFLRPNDSKALCTLEYSFFILPFYFHSPWFFSLTSRIWTKTRDWRLPMERRSLRFKFSPTLWGFSKSTPCRNSATKVQRRSLGCPCGVVEGVTCGMDYILITCGSEFINPPSLWLAPSTTSASTHIKCHRAVKFVVWIFALRYI